MNRCDICRNSLQGASAVAFSPPQQGNVHQYKICAACWGVVAKLFGEGPITQAKDSENETET